MNIQAIKEMVNLICSFLFIFFLSSAFVSFGCYAIYELF
ncbi:DUF1240 domain-containing protein, partial [Escherichia coli]|nr:DUF1240 domain-containing protein [Escherichia coli]